jgi:hypothetical protein
VIDSLDTICLGTYRFCFITKKYKIRLSLVKIFLFLKLIFNVIGELVLSKFLEKFIDLFAKKV